MKTVFLDRDGVINKRLINDYVKTWDEFEFLPGVFDAIKLLNDNGFDVIVVSNQAGISKGLYTQEDLKVINKNMQEELKKHGAVVLKSYYCPHFDDDVCDCRKPKSGLFYQAQHEFQDIKFEDSWIIGDSERDVVAGANVGCRSVLIGFDGSGNTLADYVVGDLMEAVNVVIK